MRINDTEFKKIREYEKRRGISYATTDGKLYKRLFMLGFLSWLYMMVMVLLYILGYLISASENQITWNNIFITVFCAFVVTLITPVLFVLKLRITAFTINICTVPIMAAVFIKLTSVSENTSSSGSQIEKVDFGIFGLKKLFYWRHGIPMLIVLIISIWLLIIIIRERIIIHSEFEKIKNNEYKSQIISNDE